MSRVLTFLIFGFLVLLSACDPETGILTISGDFQESMDNNPKVGIFDAATVFDLENYNEVVHVEANFVPMVVVVPNPDGSYSIDFPKDLSSTGQLVLWYDGNDNNEFGLGDSWGWESGFFPVKNVSSSDHVITGWEAIANDFIAITDNASLINLSSEGTTGFDFFQVAVD